MKRISDVIAELLEIQAVHGDLPVLKRELESQDFGDSYYFARNPDLGAERLPEGANLADVDAGEHASLIFPLEDDDMPRAGADTPRVLFID